MDAGLASLLGAVVGGAASFLGTAYGQRVQIRRDAARRAEETVERQVIAARIVQSDLGWAQGRVEQALKNGRYWSRRYELTDDAWRTYRETLASAMDTAEEWTTVRRAFRAIRTLELQAARGRTDDPLSRGALTELGREQASRSLERIRAAVAVLEPLAQLRGEADSPEADAGE